MAMGKLTDWRAWDLREVEGREAEMLPVREEEALPGAFARYFSGDLFREGGSEGRGGGAMLPIGGGLDFGGEVVASAVVVENDVELAEGDRSCSDIVPILIHCYFQQLWTDEEFLAKKVAMKGEECSMGSV